MESDLVLLIESATEKAISFCEHLTFLIQKARIVRLNFLWMCGIAEVLVGARDSAMLVHQHPRFSMNGFHERPFFVVPKTFVEVQQKTPAKALSILQIGTCTRQNSQERDLN
jgi:hypothetical protein